MAKKLTTNTICLNWRRDPMQIQAKLCTSRCFILWYSGPVRTNSVFVEGMFPIRNNDGNEAWTRRCHATSVKHSSTSSMADIPHMWVIQHFEKCQKTLLLLFCNARNLPHQRKNMAPLINQETDNCFNFKTFII